MQNSPSNNRKSVTKITTVTTSFSKQMMEQRENADLHFDLLQTKAENEH